MDNVEGAYLYFQFENNCKRIHPRQNFKFHISIGCWNYMWNGCVNLNLGYCVDIYIQEISTALIYLHKMHLCYTTFHRTQNFMIFIAFNAV
jgi:hypothetical protein